MSMLKSSWAPGLVFVGALGAIIAWRTLGPGGGVAPMPASFASASSESPMTLEAAVARGEAEGKPVLALATADWCPPCQALKRGALTDPAVQRWIDERAVAVYLDATDRDSQGSRDAGTLGIRSLPTLVLLRNGEPVHRLSGNASAQDLLRWLEGVERETEG